MTLKELLDVDYGSDSLTGTLIHLKNGKKILIGDINTLGGVCDDCRTRFLNEEIESTERIWPTQKET